MDIFERVAGAKPVLLEVSEDVTSSFQRLLVLCMEKPGDYFAYDNQQARIVAEVSAYRAQYLMY
jgi:hypothetical protein